ncbi:MAG: ABC transporter ATP-binding protein [Tenericutes bacterium]|nr:ABC transporter ATP-binding protein [Mycoplasmatota bacterium]
MKHRSHISIVFHLFKMLGFKPMFIIMLAVINGSLGYMMSIAITVLGSVGVAKLLGASLAISYQLLFIVIITCGTLRGVLRYIEQYVNHFIAFKILAILRNKLFDKLLTLSPAKLETKQKGSIISLIESDIETLEVFYAHTISPIMIAVVSSIFMTVFISEFVHLYLGLIALLSHIIVGYFIPNISMKYMSKNGQLYRDELSAFNGYYLDLIKGSNNTILNNNQTNRKQEVNKRSQALLITSNQIKIQSAKFGSMTDIIVFLLNFIMLFTGVVLINQGIVALPYVIIAVISLMSSYGPVLALNKLPNGLNQTFASGRHLMELVDEKPKLADIKGKKDFVFQKLTIEYLEFSYDKKQKVIDDLSFSIGINDIVGLYGSSGCGKSTLLKLLMYFWEKDQGTIKYNDIPIEQLNTTSLRQNVTMVNQTTYLFYDTIRNNLLIANRYASDEEMIAACKKAAIHEFILALEKGYDTIYSPKDNTDFSSGEKQRIGLARAFLSPARLLLLDEPTSNVDAINEGIILKAIKENARDKAIVIVSHRKSTLSIANQLIDMEKLL